MKFKPLTIASLMLATSASVAFAEEVCTTEVALKIKDDLTSKGSEVLGRDAAIPTHARDH